MDSTLHQSACRRIIPKSIAICLFATLLPAGLNLTQAQQPKKISPIGYLSLLDPAGESARAEAVRLALRERGYIEGQNITFEYRYAEGRRTWIGS